MSQEQKYHTNAHGLPLVESVPPMPTVATPRADDAVTASKCQALVLNVPAFFADPEFVAWLNNGQPKFSWHTEGDPDEWSDVIVLVDPGLSGEGSDCDMPGHFWRQIVSACQTEFSPAVGQPHIMVRLTNLG